MKSMVIEKKIKNKTKNDVIIAFYFEDLMKSVSSGIPDATLFRWRQNAKAFNVSRFLMIDVTTFQIGQYYQNNDSEIQFERYTNLSQIEKEYPDYKLVIFETPNTLEVKNIPYIYLPKLKHPKKAIYVVGPDGTAIDLIDGREKSATWVVVPSNTIQPIWAETVVSLALYDRYLKTSWPSP